MKHLHCLLVVALMCCSVLSAQTSAYDFTVKDGNNNDVSLSDYKGKVMLIVNTATRCGFTPQYSELQALYEKYHDQGFLILDFPCNQFMKQAPGSYEDIHKFCTSKYDITFPQFQKIDVNGDDTAPLYVWLKQQKQVEKIRWNFCKFLIDKSGQVVSYHQMTVKPTELQAEIEALLK